MNEPASEPRNLIERAADAAMEAAEAVLAEAGATLDVVVVCLNATGDQLGDVTAASAAGGPGLDDADVDERGRQLFAYLAIQTQAAGAGIGLDVRIIPGVVLGDG